MKLFREGDHLRIKRNLWNKLLDKIHGYPWWLDFYVAKDGDRILWLTDRSGAWVKPLADIEEEEYELVS